MAEAVGVVLGVVALVGTFKDCIDLFSYISTSRSLGRDDELLDAKLHVEKALLLQWAHRVRLLSREYDERLDDSTTSSAVTRILASIQHLMSESSLLQERYGLRQTEAPPPKGSPMETRAATISKLRMSRLAHEFDALQIRMNQKQKETSAAAKLRWIIKDKDKFEKLVDELSHFISRLNQLFHETEHHNQDAYKAMLSEDLSAIRSIETIRMIRDATVDRHDHVTEAAEERFLQMR